VSQLTAGASNGIFAQPGTADLRPHGQVGHRNGERLGPSGARVPRRLDANGKAAAKPPADSTAHGRRQSLPIPRAEAVPSSGPFIGGARSKPS